MLSGAEICHIADADRFRASTVMGDRSNNGVQNLRAMFENKSETTTPPSRGRSPTGSESVTSGSSRPVSKIRTSFIAVERSGQVGLQLGLQKLSDSGESESRMDEHNSSRLSSSETDPRMNGSPHANGNGSAGTVHSSQLLAKVKEEHADDGGKESVLDKQVGGDDPPISNGVQDPVSNGSLSKTAAVRSSPAQKSATKKIDQETTAPSDADNIGTVLKGSPFEPKSAESAKVAEVEKHPSTQNSIEDSSKTTEAADKTNEGSVVNGTADAVDVATKQKAESKSIPARSPTISTKQQPSTTSKIASGKSTNGLPQTPKVPTAPGQPGDTKASSPRQPHSKTSSPRQTLPVQEASKTATKEAVKAPLKKPSRTSFGLQNASGPKPHTSASKSTVPATKKSTPPSPTSTKTRQTSTTTAPTKAKASSASPPGVKKVAAKLPTQPVKLPSSATAPTAASAAKLGGHAGISRSPSRTSTSGTATTRKPAPFSKDRPSTSTRGPPSGGGSSTNARRKVSRPSLPPQQQPHDRPKSRASTVGTKPPDEGFLARMMRPTASSASKTHEKVEVKSPPRQRAMAKPKRKSEGRSVEKGSRKSESHEEVVDKQASEEAKKEAPATESPEAEAAVVADEDVLTKPCTEETGKAVDVGGS